VRAAVRNNYKRSEVISACVRRNKMTS